MPTYHYFVSFNHDDGSGSAGVPSTGALETYEAVRGLAVHLGRKFNVSNVVIINFQLLRVEP